MRPGLHTSLRLFGLEFSTQSAAEALRRVTATPATGPRMVVTANIDHVLSLSEQSAFRAAYAGAALRTLDGMPLLWLARAKGSAHAQRVTGHEVMAEILAAPPHASDRVFVVSPNERVSAGIGARLGRAGWDGTQIQAVVPPFGFERDPPYSADLAGRILQHGTTLLLMGVGAPKSEIWVHNSGASLGSPVVLCVGEALAVAAGCRRRAPLVLQRTGLEWLWRFGLSPRRLFHRYFARSWKFPLLVLLDCDLSVD